MIYVGKVQWWWHWGWQSTLKLCIWRRSWSHTWMFFFVKIQLILSCFLLFSPTCVPLPQRCSCSTWGCKGTTGGSSQRSKHSRPHHPLRCTSLFPRSSPSPPLLSAKLTPLSARPPSQGCPVCTPQAGPCWQNLCLSPPCKAPAGVSRYVRPGQARWAGVDSVTVSLFVFFWFVK